MKIDLKRTSVIIDELKADSQAFSSDPMKNAGQQA
jgi:hypothetical protein